MGDNQRLAWLLMALASYPDAVLSMAGMCAGCKAVLLMDGVAIVLMGEATLPAAAYTSDAVFGRLEELQFTLGLGPTLDAYETAEIVIEAHLDSAPPERWAGFSSVAVGSGVGAVFSFPLQLGASRLGSLTLYQLHQGLLDDERYADAMVMADVITRAILVIQSDPSDAILASELVGADIDYAEVHQASGMISVQLDIDVGEALTRLRARAFADGTSVRVTAIEVLARRLRLDR